MSDPFQWTGILWKGDVAKISDEVETIMLDAPAPLFECASQLRTKSGEMLPFYAAEVIRVEGKKVTFNPSGKADKKRCLSLAFGKTAWPEGDYALLINISWNARGPYVAPVAQDALANTFTKRTVWGAPGSGDKRMVGKTPIENVSVADLLPGAKKSVVGVSPPIPRAPEQAFFSGSWAYYAAGQPMGLVWACDIGKAKISGPYCEHLLEELVTP